MLLWFLCVSALAQMWQTLAPLPAPRYSGAAVALNNRVYYLGGSVSGGVKSAAVFVYDPAGDSWSVGDSMLSARHRFGAVECGGDLYVFGGWGARGELLNSAERYDAVAKSWSPIETMPTPRASLFAGVVNGRIYAIGGWNGASAVGAVEVFDPSTGHWTRVRSMPVPRGEGITGTPDNTILCVGGTTNGSDILDRMDRYHPERDTWYECPPIPVARLAGAGATESRKVYVYAGVGPEGRNTHAAHWFSANVWNQAEPIPSSRRYLAGCCNYPLAYAIGGLDSLMQPTALVEALELPMSVTEEEITQCALGLTAQVVRGSWLNPWSGTAVLCDATGRTVLKVVPGRNDLRQLPAGVYLAVACDQTGRTYRQKLTKLN